MELPNAEHLQPAMQIALHRRNPLPVSELASSSANRHREHRRVVQGVHAQSPVAQHLVSITLGRQDKCHQAEVPRERVMAIIECALDLYSFVNSDDNKFSGGEGLTEMRLMGEFEQVALEWEKEQLGDKIWVFKLEVKSIDRLCRWMLMKGIPEWAASRTQ